MFTNCISGTPRVVVVSDSSKCARRTERADTGYVTSCGAEIGIEVAGADIDLAGAGTHSVGQVGTGGAQLSRSR